MTPSVAYGRAVDMDRVHPLADRLLLDMQVIEAWDPTRSGEGSSDAAVAAAIADEALTRALLASQVTTDPGAAVVLFARLHAASASAIPADIVGVLERAVLVRRS